MKSPFQEDIVVDNYFPTKLTENSLQDIHAAVENGVPMIVLTGDEGTGKTMLCHKLDQDNVKSYTSVFFPHTIDSFEDVVRIMAFALDIEPESDGASRGVEEILNDVSRALEESGKPLLLIIDEAENIYLATLERIRKMLDRFTAEGGLLHVLFAGRQGFLENCDQLSMCDFQNTGELHVTLEPLSLDETRDYLFFCGEKIPDFDSSVVFTPQVVEDIYKISQGNYRMTNILAEEAVQKNGDDTSFMVLLENVKEDIGDNTVEGGALAMIRDYMAQYKSYLPYGLIAVALVVGAVYYLFANSSSPQVEQDLTIASMQSGVVDQGLVLEKSANNSEGAGAPVDEGLEEEAGDETVDVVEEPKTSVEPVAAEPELRQPSVDEVVASSQDTGNGEDVEPAREEEVAVENAAAANEEPFAKPVQVSKIAVQQKAEKKVKIVELLRDDSLKKKPGKLPKTTQETIKPVEEIEKPAQKRNAVQDVIASNAHFTTDQLYKKRVMAGSSWYNHKKDDKYTVQLMVLKSKSAEENFKEMLQEDRYRQEAGNFYIFRKLATSNTLFIFYGEYTTIAQARLAQNSLPQFLRDHKPYALSVKGAMAKVRRQ